MPYISGLVFYFVMQLTTETEYINSTNKWSDVVLEPFKNIIYKW